MTTYSVLKKYDTCTAEGYFTYMAVVDRHITKKSWWTFDSHEAMKYWDKQVAEHKANSLKWGTFIVVNSSYLNKYLGIEFPEKTDNSTKNMNWKDITITHCNYNKEMNKKLTFEDEHLTIDQAKELQELGVDFSSANSKILIAVGSESFDYIQTLSVAEMLEMLPSYIEYKNKTYNIDFDKNHRVWYIGYQRYNEQNLKTFNKFLLRDALFEMLKWLKQNKII